MGENTVGFVGKGIAQRDVCDYSCRPRVGRGDGTDSCMGQNLVGLATVACGAGAGSEVVARPRISLGGRAPDVSLRGVFSALTVPAETGPQHFGWLPLLTVIAQFINTTNERTP